MGKKPNLPFPLDVGLQEAKRLSASG